MHPGPAIRRLRKARQWKLEELASRMEPFYGRAVNTGNLSRVEREGQGYSQEFLNAAAQALEVGLDELFKTDDNFLSELADPGPRGGYRGVVAAEIVDHEVIKVPRFENPFSLGRGQEQLETDMLVGSMSISRRWVQHNLSGISAVKNLAVMFGIGDSMRPTIDEGDPVLVDRGVNDVHTDAVYAFSLSKELFIKRLQRLPGGSLRVKSDNPNYDPYDLGADTKKEMEVLARVVWAWNGRKL